MILIMVLLFSSCVISKYKTHLLTCCSASRSRNSVSFPTSFTTVLPVQGSNDTDIVFLSMKVMSNILLKFYATVLKQKGAFDDSCCFKLIFSTL